MRPSVLLAVIPLVLGCAQQSRVREMPVPSSRPMHVRLHQPTGGALNYSLSEPGYVAIFAVTRGYGISLVFPFFESQMDSPSRAGLNQQTVHGASGALGSTPGARNERRAQLGYVDAYYVIASKYPLPLEGLIRSPNLLRSLLGEALFRASSLRETLDTVETLLVAHLPEDAWASDVYHNWRDPFLSFTLPPERFFYYCGEGYGFLARSLLTVNRCASNQRLAASEPVPTTGGARRGPPAEPLDRGPSIPAGPPRLDPAAATARTSRMDNATIRGEQRPPSAAERPAPAAREQPSGPPTSRPAEASPPRQRSPDGESRPQPKPDN